MKTLKNKIVAITIAIFFILSMLASTALLSNQDVYAATLIPTTGFSYAFPAVNGVGQTEYLNGWVSPPTGNAINAYYYNETLIVTKPDGTNVTALIGTSDVGAAINAPYVCPVVGNYSVTLKWVGDATHAGCVSPPYTWTVQQAPVNTSPPNTNLPTGYWQFPISSEFYSWYTIAGGWLQNRFDGSNDQFNPYTAGPNTPHIIWRNQVVPGGLIGGTEGEYALEGLFTTTLEGDVGLTNYVSALGYLWYTTRDYTNNGTVCLADLHCLSLYTGQQIYSKDLDAPLAAPSPASVTSAFPPGRPTLILEITGQEKGGTAARTATVSGAYSLWVSGNGLREIDPQTGNTLYYNGSFSPSVYADGYFYFTLAGNLTCWSTRAHAVSWSEAGAPAPTYIWNDILVYSNKGYNGIIITTTYNATTGAMIANGTLNLYSVTLSQCIADGNIFYSCDDLRMYAVSLYTCQVVWKSDQMSYPWGEDQAYGQSAGYGIVYSGMLDGHIYAWNDTTGQLLWTYYSGSNNYTAWGTWPFWGNIVVADGKLYVATGEHTTPNPIPYGYSLFCLNATTGQCIWNDPSFSMYTFASVGFGDGVAAGILFYQNVYDGNLYAFGQGQSATTVTAPDLGATVGTPLVIRGTVTDQSPGQTCLGYPEKGTPAVSDQDQSQWMQYLFNNAPRPTNATGVPVTIYVTDSNHNTRPIGTTTSTDYGVFSLTWTPDIPGNYTVTATFAGSQAYYGSSAQTSFYASPEAAATTTPTAATSSVADTYFVPAIAGLFVAIIIIGVVLALLMLRKRP